MTTRVTEGSRRKKTAKQPVFFSIQVRAKSQTKGLERG